ncbi:MAG: HAMP domain-containing sensor histidine kinase [Bacteroidales bacterium]
MFDYKLRDSADDIREQARDIVHSSGFSSLLEDIPSLIIIMNHYRQVIYMNRKFSGSVGKNNSNLKLGMRPGECLLCVHAVNSEFGCGSTDFCKVCGFANAIRRSETGKDASGECNITLNHGETLTYSVHTRPFKHNGRPYIFAYMQDISDMKTRELLENIFLHDINNSITALNGLNELMDELPPYETKNIIKDLSMRLTDEIHSYRLITEAENHSLSVMVGRVDVDNLLGNIIKSLLNVSHLRKRKVEHVRSGIFVYTDETLLRRVLINTMKNALEASGDGQQVTVWTEINGDDGAVSINVRSYPLIPREVQLQLFQRSFSTKGSGRGWGTYSIRLLTENYLGGKVTFVSNSKQRTLFTITIPSLKMDMEG